MGESQRLQVAHQPCGAHWCRVHSFYLAHGSLCASGGKDGTAMLWDVNDGKHLYSLDAGATINALCFSPKNYWLVAATDTSIRVWDLENKDVLDELSALSPPKSGIPWCVSLSWSADGNMLFAGTTDGTIQVYEVGGA